MKLFKPYSNIKDFLYRFTILKIGKLHIRMHRIKGKDNTTLFHNHPFKYISVVLCGGYTETIMNDGNLSTATHKKGSIISRDNTIYHRIEEVKPNTLTLFFAWGNYGWKALNTNSNTKGDGVWKRNVQGKSVWSKKENGIWFIGNADKEIATNETRHSIHQVL